MRSMRASSSREAGWSPNCRIKVVLHLFEYGTSLVTDNHSHYWDLYVQDMLAILAKRKCSSYSASQSDFVETVDGHFPSIGTGLRLCPVLPFPFCSIPSIRDQVSSFINGLIVSRVTTQYSGWIEQRPGPGTHTVPRALYQSIYNKPDPNSPKMLRHSVSHLIFPFH